MTEQLQNALQAVSSSLTTIVAPAVADEDPLAQQQLMLSIAYLALVRDRMAYVAAREWRDLEDDLGVGRAVEPHLPTESAAAMREELDEAERLLQGREGAGERVRRSSARIQALASEAFELVTEEAAPALEQAVVSASHARVALERAWFLPMGFDPDPGSVQPVGELLGSVSGVES
ncbi:hypothetical protein [Nocardiopsis oceani]